MRRVLSSVVGASVLVAAIALLADSGLAGAAGGKYRLLKEIPVGGEGGWDYLTIDPVAKRLYVSHATKVVVIDLVTDQVVGEIADTPGVHGIAPAPDLGKGFTSNGRESKVSIFDLKTLQTLAKVDTGENPDAIVYEPTRKEVYTFNGKGSSSTVIDATTGKVVATIPLPGKPEFAVVDTKAGRIYNNIEDTNQIVAIDIKTHAVAATWSIAPGEGASGLAFDPVNNRLFAVCGNKTMVALDARSGTVLSTAPIGTGTDGAGFDPGPGYAFSSNSDGTMTVLRADAAGKLEVVENVTTAPRSRTMTVDRATHKIYLPSAEYAPAAAGARPAVVPNSFKIAVYGLQ